MYVPVSQRTTQKTTGYTSVGKRVQTNQINPVNFGFMGLGTQTSTPQTTSFGTGDLLKAVGQGIGRQYLATGQAIISGNQTTPFIQQSTSTPLGKFTSALTGTTTPISAKGEDVAFLGEKYGNILGGNLTLGLSVLDLYSGGGVKGLKGLVTGLKQAKSVAEASALMKTAGFVDDIIKDYAPIFAKSTDAQQIETGLLKAQELQNSTKYTPVANRNNIIPKELQPLATEARKYKSAEEFGQNITNKQFREILNDSGYTDYGTRKNKGGTYGARSREYGDHLFAQDREIFNQMFSDFKSGNGGGIAVGKYRTLTDFYNKVNKKPEVLPELPKIKVREVPTQKTTEGRQTKQVIIDKPKEIVKTESQLLRDRIRAEARGAVSASKDIRAEVSRRRNLINSIKEFFNLTDREMASALHNKDYRFMSNGEFQEFLGRVDSRAELESALSDKRVAVKGTVFEKELSKVENLQKAMKLPPVDKMDLKQLDEFDKTLEQFKQGDEFLGTRQLETVENTDLKGIHTTREARDALAKDAGVPVEELDNIKVTELDRYRYDTALARQNPFYELMVQEKNKAILNAEAGFYEIKTKLNDLINLARKSKPRGVLDKVIPTDKAIFNWLEADEVGKAKLSKEMTKEELNAANYIQKLYIEARDYLVQHKVLEKYRSDYITHIRRGFLESWREDGLLKAFKEVFDKYKQDEALFNILNEKTGDILPLEKFFQFSMRRTGELTPTKNVSSAVQAYFRAFEKKKALDSLVPKLDIYAHSLTPKRLTPKGIEFDDSLKRFVKEWVNSKKGRVADTVMVKPGGKIDWLLRTGVALTRLLDLGLSVPVGIASNFGEQITTFRGLGTSQYATGLKRLATKQGREITDKYKNFVGETLGEKLRDTADGLGDKLTTTMFSLFSAASRRANQVFLLANMTPEELAKGTISTERLAKLQTEMGRSRVVDNFESVIGKTAPGQVAKQYKSWAVPILSSTLNDITKVTEMLKKGDSVLKTQEFKELMRTVLLSGGIGFGVYGFLQEEKSNKDRTFVEELAFKSARDSLSLIGALDPSFWTTTPRLLSFLNSLGTAIKQIVFAEKNADGDLKGVNKLEETLTPRAIKQFEGEEKPPKKSLLPELPKLPSLPKLPKIQGKAEKGSRFSFGATKAYASELPNAYIRDNTLTPNDLEEAKAILFGEISNRSPEKQMLEAQTILNTAFNRMDEYRKRGVEKTLTEVLQMPNQYQAYKGKQYNKFKEGKLEKIDQQKVEAINKIIEQVLNGTFQNNIGNRVFYVHKPDGRILADNRKLFK